MNSQGVPILEVLRLPGAARAFLPSLLGRLALAMAFLAIVLAVQQNTSSLAAAGLASGAFGLATVLAAPWRARAVDRWGQRRTLPALALAQAGSYFGLAFAAQTRTTSVALYVGLSAAAGLAGPPLGAAMRIAWSSITSRGDQRRRALSLDATADELVFMVGPVLGASISSGFSPGAALAAAASALLIGTFGLTTSRVSKALPGRGPVSADAAGPRPLRRRGVKRVLVVLFGVGVVLGTVEVVAVAVAIGDHHRAASGWLLAALSAGSAVGGLVYGHVSWRTPLGQRMMLAAAAMGALTGVTAFASTVASFAVGAVAIGLFLAPSIVTGYLAVEHLVPSHAATEASVWTNTALNLGASLANAGAGALVTGMNATVAMLVAALVVVAASTFTPRGLLEARAQP